MNKIDTSKWKEFSIGELFKTELKNNKLQVPTGASIKKKNLIDGNVPRITVTGINNGIYGNFDCNIKTNDYRIYENFISVSFLGTIFYHPYKASLDMKVHCLKPKNITLNKYTGLFFVTAIKASLRDSSYADQLSSTVLPEMNIKLPISSTGEPDYIFMENFMRDIESVSNTSLSSILSFLHR